MKNILSEYAVREVKTLHIAKKVARFLVSPYAFDQKWAPNEKKIAMLAPIASLKNNNHTYWYCADGGRIVGALGIRENKYGSGGFEMDSDYVAIHTDYRRKGIGTKLLLKAEDFVKKRGGRYIHIVTCDIPSYEPAVNFYKRFGYQEVGRIKNYFVSGEGRIDFVKYMK